MSTQIAVRLPDDIVAFLDQQVDTDQAPSRAAVVLRALRREQRRALAVHDAKILAATQKPDDLDGLAEWATHHPVNIDE